ncbi:TetR/AcrR family transcriptional regulator [Aquisalimonas sp.]|uniref:TetR/AcrR family transcriptional regulator n=1 Tax=Aquisalimonas sp. TaxID=1872621 RepID=UPI0025C0CFC7|nr:TetR/AcrR family transcriptional regulator [Aquisalimonas sp.]
MTQQDQQCAKKRTRLSAEERREQILRAARAHFAEHGYRCTDVQDIADGIDVGKGTIYRHFPTKEGLFLASVEGAVEVLKSYATSSVEALDDPLKKIRAVTHVSLQFFDDHPEVVELFIQERAEFKDRDMPMYFVRAERDRPEWNVLFDQLKEQGRMRAMDSAGVSQILADTLYGTVLAHRMTGATDSLVERADTVVDFMLHGILVPGQNSA